MQDLFAGTGEVRDAARFTPRNPGLLVEGHGPHVREASTGRHEIHQRSIVRPAGFVVPRRALVELDRRCTPHDDVGVSIDPERDVSCPFASRAGRRFDLKSVPPSASALHGGHDRRGFFSSCLAGGAVAASPGIDHGQPSPAAHAADVAGLASSAPRQRLQAMLDGAAVTQLVYVAARARLADRIGTDSATVDELAGATGLHADSLSTPIRPRAACFSICRT